MISKRFLMARGGNITVVLALGAMPFCGALGMGMDYLRVSSAKTRIASAIDTAAIAANIHPRMSLAEKAQIARNIVAQRLSDTPWIAFSKADIQVTSASDGLLDVSMNADVTTPFSNVFGSRATRIAAAGQSLNIIGLGNDMQLALQTAGSASQRQASRPASRSAIFRPRSLLTGSR
jgi:Flp pilus assembly protein TadG